MIKLRNGTNSNSQKESSFGPNYFPFLIKKLEAEKNLLATENVLLKSKIELLESQLKRNEELSRKQTDIFEKEKQTLRCRVLVELMNKRSIEQHLPHHLGISGHYHQPLQLMGNEHYQNNLVSSAEIEGNNEISNFKVNIMGEEFKQNFIPELPKLEIAVGSRKQSPLCRPFIAEQSVKQDPLCHSFIVESQKRKFSSLYDEYKRNVDNKLLKLKHNGRMKVAPKSIPKSSLIKIKIDYKGFKSKHKGRLKVAPKSIPKSSKKQTCKQQILQCFKNFPDQAGNLRNVCEAMKKVGRTCKPTIRSNVSRLFMSGNLVKLGLDEKKIDCLSTAMRILNSHMDTYNIC